MNNGLRRTVTLPQVVALYVAAVVGAGVLILPGLAATEAGPASVVSWTSGLPPGISLPFIRRDTG